MKTAKELLSYNLKRLRTAKGWDQAALSDKAAISEQMVQKLEQQKTNPSLEMLDKLATGLNCSISDLYDSPEPTVTMPGGEDLPPIDMPPERASEILQELDILLQRYSRAHLDMRLLVLYILTGRESYIDRYEGLPDADLIVSEALRQLISAS